MLHVPPGAAGTNGDLVAETAEMMGRPLDPHQRAAVDALASYAPGGAPLTMEGAIVGPRQTTGKTSAVLMPIVLTDVLTRNDDPDLVIWTAHRAFAALAPFKDLKEIIEGCPDVSAHVKAVSDKDGEEAVRFHNGWEWQFRTRSEGAGRSLSAGIVVADEALYLTAGMAGDLLPTMASRRSPRLLYASSHPKASSAHLHEVLRRGRAGDPRLILVEYRAPGTLKAAGCEQPKCLHAEGAPGCALDRPDLLRFANPGLTSGRIGWATMGTLRSALVPLEYAREMLGYEEDPDGGGDTIPLSAWLARADPASRIADGSPRVLAFDISPDRSTAAITGAGWRADGDMHLDLAERDRGTSWLVPRIVDIVARRRPAAIVVDGASPAGTEIEALAQHGIRRRTESAPHELLIVMGAQDMARACGQLFDGVAGDAPSMWHRGDPIVEAALRCAVRRDVGDGGWAFGRKKSEGDIAPIVAMAEVAWGLAQMHAQPASAVF